MFETIDRSIIVELEDALGPTLVAMVSANRDRHIVDKWLDGSAKPTSEEVRRLEFAYEQFRRVADETQNAHLARSWFIGSSITGGTTPAMAIREGNFEEVIASATRLIEDTW